MTTAATEVAAGATALHTESKVSDAKYMTKTFFKGVGIGVAKPFIWTGQQLNPGLKTASRNQSLVSLNKSEKIYNDRYVNLKSSVNNKKDIGFRPGTRTIKKLEK